MDSRYFYSKINVEQKDKPSSEHMHEGLEELSDGEGNYTALPYGVSIATPSTLPNSTTINNNSVSVLVNQMVYDNIQ